MADHVGKVTEVYINGYDWFRWSCKCAASSQSKSYKTKQEAQDRLNAHIERMK